MFGHLCLSVMLIIFGIVGLIDPDFFRNIVDWEYEQTTDWERWMVRISLIWIIAGLVIILYYVLID